MSGQIQREWTASTTSVLRDSRWDVFATGTNATGTTYPYYVATGGTPITYTATTTNSAAYEPLRHHTVERRLTDEMTREWAADPDAHLGDMLDEMRREIEEVVMREEGISADEVWRSWTVDVHSRRDADDVWVYWMSATPRSAGRADGIGEEWQAQTPDGRELARTVRAEERDRRRREIIVANRRRSRELRKRIAARRARRLLMECLSPEQREDLERANRFRVHLPSGRVYEVAKGYAGNVYLLDVAGRRRTRFCIHGPSSLPDEDHMLAQKLLLETDEEEFCRVANASAVG